MDKEPKPEAGSNSRGSIGTEVGGTQQMVQNEKTHPKETHGRSDDIDEDTPVDQIKAPGVFERAKEEIEAVVDAVIPKKGSGQ